MVRIVNWMSRWKFSRGCPGREADALAVVWQSTFFAVVVFLLISIIVFLAALHGQPLESLFALAPKKHSGPRPDVRVWANKESGLYY